jgi:hypothetical protein
LNVITIHKTNYSVPSSWSEITNDQLIKVAPLIFGSPESMMVRKGLALLFLLPDLKRYYSRLTDGQKWDLFNLTDWLFEDISGRSVVRTFTHKNVEYFLPEDNLRKESIIAFSFADNYFQQFINTKDPLYLDKVIACIARQKGSYDFPALQETEGDHREHFSTSRTLERSKAFLDLPIGIKNAVLLFFMGSKKFIHKQYEILFTKKEEPVKSPADKKANFGKKKIPKPDYGWIGIIYDLAEQKTFGSFDQVKHQFLHTCCYYLTKKKYEQEEQTA